MSRIFLNELRDAVMLHELTLIIPYFFFIGILVGILSMLFGIGGGLVIVPAINLFLRHLGYTHHLSMNIAVATSLFTILFSTLNVLRQKHNKGDVPWFLVRQFLPCLMAGTVIGVIIASKVPGVWLTYLFIIFLFYVIVRAILNKSFKATYQMKDFLEPSAVSKSTVGFVVGLLSVLIGVGGNVLLVPYLRRHKLPMKNIVAFTVGLVPFIASVGSMGYFIEGLALDKKIMPAYSMGYINLPAFFLITLGSFLGAFLGQKLLVFIQDAVQAKAYLIFLIIVLCFMLLGV